MISREKFDQLTEEEKGILGLSIGYPDFRSDDLLFEAINGREMEIFFHEDLFKKYVKVLNKLL